MRQRTTPRELGFRLPAEWEPQAAVWFAWPTCDDLWPGRLGRVRAQLAELYVLAAKYQPVRVLCASDSQEQLLGLLASVGGSDGVELFDCVTDDIWIRDFGPLFLLRENPAELGVADWRFNAWGNKFPRQQNDDRASSWIAERLGLPCFAFDMVLEGGAIESNGEGQLMTTEAVLLNPNRNGEVSVQEVEQKLCSGLGVDSVFWLKDGLVGDDTDGHIDNLARFYASEGILVADTVERMDPNFNSLQENITRLQEFRTPDGRPFETIQLPVPVVQGLDGEPLAASYLNYLVLNGAVLVPTYRQAAFDQMAIATLRNCFPDREVIGVDCFDFIHEGGALHCMSQNQPAI